MDSLGLFRFVNEDDTLPKIYVAVITVISYGVSMLFLCTHLIVFSITEGMWTTMGKNLASFCLSLLFNLFIFIGVVIMPLEQLNFLIVAILTYYFSLTRLNWLLCMSFESWRSLGKTRSQRDYEIKHSSRFVWYSMFSWLEPGLFVGMAVYSHVQHGNHPFPVFKELPLENFGSMGSWVAANTAFLLFFGLPFCVHVALNLLFLGGAKYRSTKLDPLRNAETIVEARLYSRLNLLTVFMWLTKVIMIFTQNEILIVVLVVMNAIQSLYIFLVFTFNNKISTLVYENQGIDLHTLLKNDGENEPDREQLVSRAAVITDV